MVIPGAAGTGKQDKDTVMTGQEQQDEEKDKKNDDFVQDSLGRDRNRRMGKMADSAPAIDFKINDETREIMLSYTNVNQCKINFYIINTEVLFSERPFLGLNKSGGGAGAAGGNGNDDENSMFSYIAPNYVIELTNKEMNSEFGIGTCNVDIPNELRNKNVFIQIVSDTLSVNKAFYDNQVVVQIKENYGQLKVLRKQGKMRPVGKAYVKVFALTRGGNHEFYKDGYTDIRGRFDYCSISTDQLERTTKFAILVDGDDLGCVVKQALPPKQ